MLSLQEVHGSGGLCRAPAVVKKCAFVGGGDVVVPVILEVRCFICFCALLVSGFISATLLVSHLIAGSPGSECLAPGHVSLSRIVT